MEASFSPDTALLQLSFLTEVTRSQHSEVTDGRAAREGKCRAFLSGVT